MLTNNLCLMVVFILCNEISVGICNNRPIIGILTQELSDFLTKPFPNPKYHSYIAASYVKFVHSSGAQVVPIFIGQKKRYYKRITNYINGILLPGGEAPFDLDGPGYAGASKKLYDLAIKKNIPILGICLGFEMLAILATGRDILNVCNVNGVNLPLEFSEDYEKSAIYGNAPAEIIDILNNTDNTYNGHDFCLTTKNMTETNMIEDWMIVSTNTFNGAEFVSTIESKKYPFWGIQFHPEKNNFEWFQRNYSHSDEAIRVSQYYGNFFVNATRQNTNKFPTPEDEMDSLIYNYKPVFTGRKIPFTETYFFKKQNTIKPNKITEKSQYNGIGRVVSCSLSALFFASFCLLLKMKTYFL